ncbi:phytanoyl-CoA dioxygenase family protein [Mesorhizobium sp. M0618]|uniref:phytanoyl-CoA dioxygenase family protein n=1 Tax=unclassified Mesorhizobium TaxID=325217 RepID=UPI00333C785D
MSAEMISETVLHEIERDGFAGPFKTDIPRGSLLRAAAYVDAVLSERRPNPLYGRFSVRDYHLVERRLLDILACDAIVDRAAQILDENVLLWRSKIFCKPPGEGPLGWHQEWGAFNGEEIGNDRPALVPVSSRRDRPWNLTVWVALDDVEPDMGPVRFARGSHRRRFPIAMEPLVRSEFFLDPFIGIISVEELVRRAQANALVLDIDTARYFDGTDPTSITLEEARAHVVGCLKAEKGAATLGFEPGEHEIVSVPMPAGSFVLFYERTMHGSSANNSQRRRLGINARFTPSDTTVYPFHTSADPIDGSNLDVRKHASVLVRGADLNPANRVIALGDLLNTFQ